MADISDRGRTTPDLSRGRCRMNRARGPVDRFHRWIESAEQTTTYLTLVTLARYLDYSLRHPEKAADAHARTRTSSAAASDLRDWVDRLARLDRYLAARRATAAGLKLAERVEGRP